MDLGFADFARFAAALGVVLGLIALAAFLARRFGLSDNAGPRAGKTRRLGIVEALTLDPKRRLVLVRRDEREHLILLGPAGDLVVDAGIERPAGLPGAARPSGEPPGTGTPA